MCFIQRVLGTNRTSGYIRGQQTRAKFTRRLRLEALEERLNLDGGLLQLVGLPSTVTAGQQVTVTVKALDALGLDNVGFANTVHFTSTDPAAELPTDYTFSPSLDLGAHTFTGEVVFNTPGNQTLTIEDLNLPLLGGFSANVNVVSAAAPVAALELSTSADPTAGNVFNVTARAVDSNGNVVPTYTGTIHFTSSDPQAALPADYTFSPADAGSHTFAITLKSSGNQSVSIGDLDNASLNVTLPGITVSPAAATTAQFSTQPVTGASNALFSPTVTLRDSFGNVASNTSTPVTLQLAGDVGNATLEGTTTVDPVNGVASFSNISVNGLAIGAILQAKIGAITVNSAPFNSIPLSSILPVVVAPQIYGPSPSNQLDAYVKGIYRTLLGRDADAAGVSFWTGQISSGASRAAIINSFYNSPENRGREVDTYYRIYLGRGAEQQGREFWINALQNGADETAIVRFFLLSPEQLRASDQTFVERLYQGALARNASQGEVDYWLGQLQNGVTRQQMADSFIFSSEAAGVAIDSYYGAYLQRHSDASGRAFWVDSIRSQETAYSVAAKALLASDEFFAKAGAAV